MRIVVALLGISIFLAATPGRVDAYFDELGPRIDRGEPAAFREVLRLADTTQPGEQLEDLAKLASRFVRSNPEAFLRAQPSTLDCFGVDFLGDRFVDRPAARQSEIARRKAALGSVADPALARARKACLSKLGDAV